MRLRAAPRGQALRHPLAQLPGGSAEESARVTDRTWALHMRELLDQAQGVRLDLASYTADFEERFWRIGGEDFWKLECLQEYQETGFPSWEACRAGQWERSLHLIEELRPEFEQYYRRASAAGFRLHRVRVVERPVTPYTQWELEVLNLRSQCGEQVTVVDGLREPRDPEADPVRLPDLVVLGTEAVYEVHYGEGGSPAGATRHTAPAVVEGARGFIQRLHRSGESLESYYPREIAGLGAPQL